jgi:hypothetical protein
MRRVAIDMLDWRSKVEISDQEKPYFQMFDKETHPF